MTIHMYVCVPTDDKAIDVEGALRTLFFDLFHNYNVNTVTSSQMYEFHFHILFDDNVPRDYIAGLLHFLEYFIPHGMVFATSAKGIIRPEEAGARKAVEAVTRLRNHYKPEAWHYRLIQARLDTFIEAHQNED